jgi:hypothetical protein
MATYRIHVPLHRHEGQKTGRVRSCTRGTRIEAPAGEFADLQPGRDYSRIDEPETDVDAGEPDVDPDSESTDTDS